MSRKPKKFRSVILPLLILSIMGYSLSKTLLGPKAYTRSPASYSAQGFDIWKSALVFQVRTTGRVDFHARLDALSQLAKENPGATQSQLLQAMKPIDLHIDPIVRQFRVNSSEIKGVVNPSATRPLLEAVLEGGKSIPGQAGLVFHAADFARKWAELQSEEYFKSLSEPHQGAFEIAKGKQTFTAAFELQEFVDRLGEELKRNPELAAAVGVMTQDLMPGVGPGSSPQEILDLLPIYSMKSDMRSILNQMNRGGLVREQDLTHLIHGQFKSVTLTFQANHQAIRSQLMGLNELRRADIRTQLEQQIAAQRREIEKRADGEGRAATVYLLSKALEGLGNPKAAKFFQSTFPAILKLNESFSLFKDALKLPEMSSAATMSAIGLGANGLGAVLVLFNAFNDQPNPDQVIIEQLNLMRHEIREFRTENRHYFSAIDSKLNYIYERMEMGLEAIAQNGRLNLEASQGIHVRLEEMQMALYGIEHRLDNQIHELGIQPLRRKVSECIKNRTFKDVAPALSDVKGCLGEFTSYAHGLQSRRGETLPIPRAAVWPNSIEQDLGLLNQLAIELFKKNLIDLKTLVQLDGAIPNPLIWAQAAESVIEYTDIIPYALLGMDTQLIHKIALGGRLVSQITSNITTGSVVLETALNDYEKIVSEISAMSTEILAHWQQEKAAGVGITATATQSAPSNPYQAPPHLPRCPNFEFKDPDLAKGPVRAEYSHLPNDLESPVHLEDSFPEYAKLAELVGLGKMTSCISFIGWSEVHNCNHDRNRFRNRECGTFAVGIQGSVGIAPIYDWVLEQKEVEREFTIRGGAASKWLSPKRALGEAWPTLKHIGARTGWKERDTAEIKRVVSERFGTLNQNLMDELRTPNPQSAWGGPWKILVEQSNLVAGTLRAMVFLGFGQSIMHNDFIRSLVYSPGGRISGLFSEGNNYSQFISISKWAEAENKKIQGLKEFWASRMELHLLPEAHPWVSGINRKMEALLLKKEKEMPTRPLSEVLTLLTEKIDAVRRP